MKAVHFGAGSIGRGFIGERLHFSGYEVTFIDVNDEIINQINQNSGYSLYRIEDGYERVIIDRCQAVSSVAEPDKAIQEIAEADIVTTSVLAGNLKHVAPVLLAGLRARHVNNKPRINVLACENAVGNSQILRQCMIDLDPTCADFIDVVAAFANTEVDRLVLASERDGERAIDIGREYELAIDETQIVDGTKGLTEGATYTDQLEKYIERKLFIINGGHVWAGFIGHLRGYTVMQDVFAQPELTQMVKQTMAECGALISQKYGFTASEIDAYIDFAVGRFMTPGIVDTVARVCRSPIRKLKAHERLVSPAVQCAERGLNNERLLQGIAAAFLYSNSEDQESVELGNYVASRGIEHAVPHFTGIEPGNGMYAKIVRFYDRFKKEGVSDLSF